MWNENKTKCQESTKTVETSHSGRIVLRWNRPVHRSWYNAQRSAPVRTAAAKTINRDNADTGNGHEKTLLFISLFGAQCHESRFGAVLFMIQPRNCVRSSELRLAPYDWFIIQNTTRSTDDFPVSISSFNTFPQWLKNVVVIIGPGSSIEQSVIHFQHQPVSVQKWFQTALFLRYDDTLRGNLIGFESPFMTGTFKATMEFQFFRRKLLKY